MIVLKFAFQRLQCVIALSRMRNEHLRILLEYCRHRDHRDLFARIVEHDEGIRRQAEINPSGGEQLGMVDLWAALADHHIEAFFLIKAPGMRLVKAAMFGLRPPIGAERYTIGSPCR